MLFVPDTPRVRLLLAALLGLAWEPLLARLFYFAGYVDVPLIQLLFRMHLTTKAQFHSLSRTVLALVWAVLLVLLFGLPLGLLARRNVLACWLAFALGALVGAFLFNWMRGSGVLGALAGWSLPEIWL